MQNTWLDSSLSASQTATATEISRWHAVMVPGCQKLSVAVSLSDKCRPGDSPGGRSKLFNSQIISRQLQPTSHQIMSLATCIKNHFRYRCSSSSYCCQSTYHSRLSHPDNSIPRAWHTMARDTTWYLQEKPLVAGGCFCRPEQSSHRLDEKEENTKRKDE